MPHLASPTVKPTPGHEGKVLSKRNEDPYPHSNLVLPFSEDPYPQNCTFRSSTFRHTKLRIIINISIFSSKHKNSKETDATTSETNDLNPTDGHPVSQTRKIRLLIHQHVFKSGYQTLIFILFMRNDLPWYGTTSA